MGSLVMRKMEWKNLYLICNETLSSENMKPSKLKRRIVLITPNILANQLNTWKDFLRFQQKKGINNNIILYLHCMPLMKPVI